MKRYLIAWKQLFKVFKVREVLDALLAGFVFSFLVFAPIYAMLGEAIAVYMYLIYTLVTLIVAAVMGFFLLWTHLTKTSFLKKRHGDVAPFDIAYFTTVNLVVIETIALVMGIVFLLVILPMLLV